MIPEPLKQNTVSLLEKLYPGRRGEAFEMSAVIDDAGDLVARLESDVAEVRGRLEGATAPRRCDDFWVIEGVTPEGQIAHRVSSTCSCGRPREECRAREEVGL